MSVAGFLARYPEFGDERAPTDLISANLSAAGREVDPVVFGSVTSDAIYALAADKIAASPWGQQARLEPSASIKTTYVLEYERLRTQRAPGAIVLY